MSWIEDPGADFFGGLDLRKLGIDEAYLNVTSFRSEAYLYSLSDDCYRCPFTKVSKLDANTVLKINTARREIWRIFKDGLSHTIPQNDKSKLICEVEPDVGEFGVYNLIVERRSCSFKEAKEAVNIYYPLLIIFFLLIGVGVLYQVAKLFLKRVNKKDAVMEKPVKKFRLKSLDTFRGMSIVLMIFVNDGAGGYWWLEHATWNGLTVGDLVFPWFLWIMGVCIPLSVRSLMNSGIPKLVALLNIFRRSCTLFLLGLALGSIGSPLIGEMRIFGVLQRFAISYYVVGSVCVILAERKPLELKGKFSKIFIDLAEMGPHWLFAFILIGAYLAITFLVPVPGCPEGYLGPGGKQDNWLYENCTGGVVKYIDRLILGESHLYQYPTASFVYETGSFDPEGIFGCILSIVHVVIGAQAGNVLIHHRKSWKQVLTRWLIWGTLTGMIGAVLCGFSKEDGPIPINKNLWSLSFVMVTSCFAFFLLSLCYILVDVLRWWSGSPFLQPGMNAITMYVGHSICYNIFPFHWRIPNMRTHFIFLLEATWGTLLWIMVAYLMRWKKVYITV